MMAALCSLRLSVVCRSCCGGIVSKDSAQRKSAVCGGPRNLGLGPDGKDGGGVFEARMLCAAGVFGGWRLMPEKGVGKPG